MMYAIIIMCSVSAPSCNMANSDVLARIRVPNEDICRQVAAEIARVASHAFPNDKASFNCHREDDV